MNKFDSIVRKSKLKRLSSIALQIESLLRQAGDLAEELDDHSIGYFFVSTLDQNSLSCFCVGDSRQLGHAAKEGAERNPLAAEFVAHLATWLAPNPPTANK